MAFRARHLGVLLLSLSMGCVTVSSPWNFSRSLLRRDKEIQHGEKSPDQAEEEDADEPLVASNVEETKQPAASGLKHDPATRMLIEEELRDAAPDERAEWIAFLGTVETAEVAELLKERRMANRREPEQIASSEQKTALESSEVVPAAHSIAPDGTKGPAENAETVTTAAGAEESHVASEAPQIAAVGTPTGPAWQKKFRSITDPNWLWTHPSNEAVEEHPAPPVKPDRGPFGLPQIRSNRNENTASVVPGTRPEATAPAPAVQQLPQTASIESRITPGSALWEDEISKLISLLEAEVSSVPGPGSNDGRQETRKQIALRMLYLVADDPQKALQVIPGLPPEEQEFWTALFLGLSEYLDHAGTNDPAERATQTIAQLRTAAYHLQQSANLRLRNLSFCQQINGFGNYETFPTDQFSPGQTVLIYAEIRNFRSMPTDDGLFLTRIRSTIEIYTIGNGQQLVDRNAFDPTEDRSRTLRTDYYHSYRVDLPANLTSGPHLVKLILQDELTGKQTTESINFTVK